MVEKYAVSVERFYIIPADETSKKWPGHGYPETKQTYNDFILFDTKEEFQDWVIANEGNKFKAWKVLELEVEVVPTVNVQLKLK